MSEELVMRALSGGETEVTRECECGHLMRGTRQSYHYTECGLSSVKLTNVLVFQCECGIRVPELPALAQLHALIAVELLRKETLLAGEEVRFLRKVAGLSQVELAKIMGVDPTRPSKWEREGTSKQSDRLLRVFCLLGLSQQLFGEKDSDEIAALAASEAIRALDAKKLLLSMREKKTPPRSVEVENNASAGVENTWFLPAVPLPDPKSAVQ